MRLLLDTCTAVWAMTESGRLSARARQALESGDAVHVSAVSPWEFGIKSVRYGLPPLPWDDFVRRRPMRALPLAFETYRHVAALPPIHADPFDRVLIAQARLHGLTLVTPDEKIREYDIGVIW